MFIYLFNLFSIPLYALLMSVFRRAKSQRGILCCIVGIQLFLTAALRGTLVGGDLQNYIPAFKYIGGLSWEDLFTYPWEYGYVLLNKVMYSLSPDEHWFLAVIALIVVIGNILYIFKYSTMCWISLFLYVALGFYCDSLSMLRQSIAIVCILVSVQYVIKNDFKRFICCIIIGTCFHTTAIAFLLLYPLTRFKVSFVYLVSFLIGIYFFSIFAGKFILFSIIETYYTTYEGNVVSGEGYGMLLLLMLITVIGVYVQTKLGVEDKKMNIFSHMMILACGLQLFSLQFSLFARIVLYFQLAIIIYIPMVLSYLKQKEVSYLGYLGVLVLTTYYFLNIYLENDSSMVTPYLFLWE